MGVSICGHRTSLSSTATRRSSSLMYLSFRSLERAADCRLARIRLVRLASSKASDWNCPPAAMLCSYRHCACGVASLRAASLRPHPTRLVGPACPKWPPSKHLLCASSTAGAPDPAPDALSGYPTSGHGEDACKRAPRAYPDGAAHYKEVRLLARPRRHHLAAVTISATSHPPSSVCAPGKGIAGARACIPGAVMLVRRRSLNLKPAVGRAWLFRAEGAD
jgi:hypothetical protein